MSVNEGAKVFLLIRLNKITQKFKADRLQSEGDKAFLYTRGNCIAVVHLGPGDMLIDEAAIADPPKKVEAT